MSIEVLNRRRQRDATYVRWKGFPPPDGTGNWIDGSGTPDNYLFNPIDIGEAGPWRPEQFLLVLESQWSLNPSEEGWPTLGLVDQRIVFTLQHSDTWLGDFVDTSPQVTALLTAADSGDGMEPRKTICLAVPIPLKRYLVVKQVCDVGDGDPSSHGGTSFSVVF
jgi:hypothetical protein